MKRNLFSQVIVHNFGLKIVSLSIAVLLWVAITSAPRAEIGFTVPIELLNIPDGFEINTEFSPQAQVRVRGSERAVRRIQPEDLHVVIDTASLAKMQPGERTFELTAAQVKLPAGVEVVQVIPSSVRLSFDRRAYRDLEVRPRVMGSFPTGYKIKSVWSEPAKVSVVGPERHVSSVEAAMTDAIDASGVVGEQKFAAVPYVQDPMVRLARPTTVRVTVVTEKTK